MEKEKLLRILENGKQIGISRIIEVDGEQIVYTCAMQKKQGRYVMYTDEYNLNTFYADQMDENTETISWYDNQDDCLSHFQPKYGIQFEELGISKGQKFFHIDC